MTRGTSLVPNSRNAHKVHKISFNAVSIPDDTDPDKYSLALTPILLHTLTGTFQTEALIDSGSTLNVIHPDFLTKYSIPTICKTTILQGEVVDGRPLLAPIISEVPLAMSIQDHHERLVFDVVASGQYPVILGRPWLRKHDPKVDWETSLLSFNSEYCKASCTSSPGKHSNLPLEASSTTSDAQKKPKTKKINIALLSARLFKRLFRRPHSIPYVGVLRLNQDGLTDNSAADLTENVPAQYADLLEFWSKDNADTLPELSTGNIHPIPLEPGTKPPFGPLYNLSTIELAVLREYLEENVKKGFIRPSTSSAGSPILFVRKKDGSLRLCVDYRGLNKITIKNRYPLPLISELLDRLSNAKIYTRLDIRNAYHRCRIKPSDEWKTAFRTRYGHFEYLVMPFGLTNAPATFQTLINDTLGELLDECCIAYIDDVLIYSSSPEEHEVDVRKVIVRLQNRGLYAKASKCEFNKTETTFLGYVISPGGVSMDPSKVEAVTEWPIPTCVRDVQAFLGLANFYRRFIRHYSRIAKHLTSLLKKNFKFEWSSGVQKAFNTLKTAFTSAPILRHYDPTLPTRIETDACDYVVAGALLQRAKDDGLWHPAAFYSKKLDSSQLNWEIYDKELFGIITALRKWRHFLEGIEFEAHTDHRNLTPFMTTRTLNRRQARWYEELTSFHFTLHHLPGTANTVADALSRRSDLIPKGGDTSTNERILIPAERVVRDDTPIRISSIQIKAVSIAPAKLPLGRKIRQGLLRDPISQEILEYLATDPKDRSPAHPPAPGIQSYSQQDGFLLFKNLIYIPNDDSIKLQLLRLHHDSPVAGHYGMAKTFELLSRNYYWPRQRSFVNDYVASCEVCKRNKTPRQKPFGLLQPLEAPYSPWSSVSMDFIVKLPISRGHDSILVVVDRHTKLGHFIPCSETITAPQFAELFIRDVFKHHGLPRDIVSDRGSVFMSSFWQTLCSKLGISANYSTAYHPQTDGQTERVNQTLEQFLRCFISYQQDDWVDFLPLAEFTHNNAEHTSTGMSPFYAMYGYHPRFDLSIVQTFPTTGTRSLNANAEERLQHLHEIQEDLTATLHTAIKKYSKYYDVHAKDAPQLRVGDKVWLHRRGGITTPRPSPKLDYKRMGPFTITQQVNPVAYRIELPPSAAIHNVFHISMLEPYHESSTPGRRQMPPPPVEIDGHELYIVDKILAQRVRRRQLQYLVRWQGYGPADDTWEPLSYVKNARQPLREFQKSRTSQELSLGKGSTVKDARQRRKTSMTNMYKSR